MDLFLPLAIQLLARRIVRLFRLKWVREILYYVAESGRFKADPLKAACAKRPHSGGHWPGKKLNNVGEDIGKPSYL